MKTRSFVAAALALLAASCAVPPAQKAGLDRVEHVIVIYAENRSFDNLYGLFPGANGIANADETAIQIRPCRQALRDATLGNEHQPEAAGD